MRFNTKDGEGMTPCKSLAMLADVARFLHVTVFEPYPVPRGHSARWFNRGGESGFRILEVVQLPRKSQVHTSHPES